jgi:cytoskeleton protein RodZ
MAGYDDQGLAIGDVLKRSRTGQGIDIRTIEDQTKIRTKYLRALENEEWDVLPSHAYAKGFLRTYAQALGLDGDALVDEYRRQVESASPGTYPQAFGEPVLEGRGRPPGRDRGFWPAAAVIGLVVIGLLAVLFLVGVIGDDDGRRTQAERRADKRERVQERKRKQRRQEARRERRQERQEAAGTVTMRLELSSDVQVCLLGEGDQPLVDDQVLPAGTVEGPYTAPRFDLRFPFGYDVEQFNLFLNGERTRVPETQGPSAFRVTPPRRIQQVEFPGTGCP